jgi:hypothetical protein
VGHFPRRKCQDSATHFSKQIKTEYKLKEMLICKIYYKNQKSADILLLQTTL